VSLNKLRGDPEDFFDLGCQTGSYSQETSFNAVPDLDLPIFLRWTYVAHVEFLLIQVFV
jgi:hypothetical protein